MVTTRATQIQPPITPVGRERLRLELDRLLQQLQAANAWLREEMQHRDGDYNRHLTHEELVQLQRRIAQIQALLEGTAEAETPPATDGGVAVGSRVTVCDETGKEQCFTIVSPFETDPARGFVSFSSPVGAALLGKATGDLVTVEAPRGERKLTVISIE